MTQTTSFTAVPARALIALVFLIPASVVAAPSLPTKGFVGDQLEVPLRAGQGNQHKITRLLAAGTPLTILDQNGKTGYSLVKLDTGEQGWLPTKYLSSDPPARSLLEASETERRRLEQELMALKGNKEAVDPASAQAEIDRLKTELVTIRQASANAIQIQEERDRLQERVIDLERDSETLRREKGAMDGDYRQSWFLTGAGVLFGGILLGLILPKLSWRKKSSWDSF